MKTKTKWLDPKLHSLSCHLALFTCEKDLAKEMQRLKIKPHNWPAFKPTALARAEVVYMENNRTGAQIAIVLFPPVPKNWDGIKIASCLAHEAVHVWQFHLDLVGDKRDHSKEFEAYAIDAITEDLLREFYRQTKGKHHAKN